MTTQTLTKWAVRAFAALGFLAFLAAVLVGFLLWGMSEKEKAEAAERSAEVQKLKKELAN